MMPKPFQKVPCVGAVGRWKQCMSEWGTGSHPQFLISHPSHILVCSERSFTAFSDREQTVNKAKQTFLQSSNYVSNFSIPALRSQQDQQAKLGLLATQPEGLNRRRNTRGIRCAEKIQAFG